MAFNTIHEVVMKMNMRKLMGGIVTGLAVMMVGGLFVGCGGDASVYPFGERERINGSHNDGKVHSAEESIDMLPGSSWKLAGFETYENGAVSMESIPDGLVYTITFGEDGRAGGMADCKGYSYAYELTEKGDDLTVAFTDPAPQIMVMCSNPEVDGRFYAGITGAEYLVSTGKSLRIYYGDEAGAVRHALYFVPAEQAEGSGAKPLEFVPFALVLHASSPYTLAPEGLNGEEKVWIDGDILHVRVAYSGGCEDHDFDLYADSDATLIDAAGQPAPQTLHLIHTMSAPDMCEAYITEVRQFDISPLKKKLVAEGLSSGTVTLTIQPLDGSPQSVTVDYRF